MGVLSCARSQPRLPWVTRTVPRVSSHQGTEWSPFSATAPLVPRAVPVLSPRFHGRAELCPFLAAAPISVPSCPFSALVSVLSCACSWPLLPPMH